MIEEYFGDIPRGPDVTELSGIEPPHDVERRQIVEDKNANVPAVFITYVIPDVLHDDMEALELLGAILTDGESSRMHKRLVKKEEAAVVVFGGVDARKGPGLFRFISASNVGVEIDKCEALMYEEIDKVKAEGIDAKELEKAKTQFKANFIMGRQTVLNKAEAIHNYVYFAKDLAKINTDLDNYMAVTSDDIKRVANEYLVENNRTVVICNPASKEG